MPRYYNRDSGRRTIKKAKKHSKGLQLEHLETRQMFSVDLAINALPPATTALPIPLISSPPAIGAGDPTPLDIYWAPIVFAGTDFSVARNALTQLSAELITNGPVNMSFAWSVVSGPGTATFSDSTALNPTVHFDTVGTYLLDLTVTTNGATKSDQVAVNVTPSINSNPIFTSSSVVSVTENTASVLAVTAIDADVPIQSLSFSIVGGADQAKFAITNGGMLSFKVVPNYEAPTDVNSDNVYIVTVQASDGVGGTATQTVSVTVTPVNDNNPIITSPTSVDVADGTTSVMTVTASDADSPVQWLSFSIVGGTDQSKFSISTGGILSFKSAPSYALPADANGDNIYEVAVQASDGAGGTVAQTIAVRVTASSVINIDQAWLDAQGDGPYYLDQQSKTYRLQTDITAAGTAFAIIAPNVTLDLNGHTITYDNATPIAIPNGSFENGTGSVASDWDFGSAPHAFRYQGVWLHDEVYDGNFSLKFADTTVNEFVQSTTAITLEPNTTYSLSAMFEYGGQGDVVNPGAKGYVRLIREGFTSREVSHNTGNGHGIQLRESVFTTGNAAETYFVQVGVEGYSGSNKPVFIDDIRIQRTRTYGVTTATKSWSAGDYPGLDHWGTGTNATIKNGTIIQGADGATWGHGIFVHATAGVTIQDLHITVRGANSSTLYGKDQGVSASIVTGNTLTSNVTTITARDMFDGSVIFGLQGEIKNNLITNGVHSGIVAAGGIASDIYSNTIRLKSKYTNGFAIRASKGSQIHENIIDCGTGIYAARGILTSGDSNPANKTRVYGNTIRVQNFLNNQEYEGPQLGGVYGIQLENAKNVEVYNNSVFAYGTEVKAYAFRMNSDGGTSESVYVHDNSFHAVNNGSHAAALKFTGIESDDLTFDNNTIITNDGIVGDTKTSVVELKRSRLIVDTPIADPFIFETDYTSASGLHTQISFYDTSFNDTNSLNYFRNATVRTSHIYNSGLGVPDTKMLFGAKWTTTIQVNDANGMTQPNIQVTITDVQNNQVFSGISNANGRIVVILSEFQIQGSTKSNYGPFTVTANIGGQPVSAQVTADKEQSVTVQAPPVGNKSSSPNNSSSIERLAAAQSLASASPTAVLSGGQLHVAGTDDNDNIKFYQSGKNICIQGVARCWSASKVKSIYVDPRGGEDFISFDSYANGGNALLKEAASVVGGAGMKRMSVGAAYDAYFSGLGKYARVNSNRDVTLNGVVLNLQNHATGSLENGVLAITGTNGNDTLSFKQVNGRIYVAGVTGSFKAKYVNSIVVRLQSGNDNVSLDSLSNGGLENLAAPVTIYSGVGTQSVRLASGYDIDVSGAGHTLYINTHGTAFLDGRQVYPTLGNWFDANVQDVALRTLGHTLYLDNLIDRNDILALFYDSEDGGVVDAIELADLQKIANNTTLFGSSDYLHSLTNYIANGSAANANYQGQALGNLTPDSGSGQLDKLVNKWFFGLDRPAADGNYRQVAGSLFVSGPAYSDIRQGVAGDSYYLAALAETSICEGGKIASMFIANGDGTYGVRFYDPLGYAQYVTVDSCLPTDVNGRLVYAGRGQIYDSTSNELWVALAEKAYAQLNEFGWSREGFASSGENSYIALSGGYIHQVLGQLTRSTTSNFIGTVGGTSFNDFIFAYSSGKQIGFGSFSTPTTLSGVVGNQAYAVVSYDSASQNVVLFNPWGIEFGPTTMNWSQIQQNFEYFEHTA